MSKIKELKNKICCTIETNNKTVKLQKNHAYVLKSIEDDIWYLHNPHYTINDSKGCITINENELIYNIDIITYIIL